MNGDAMMPPIPRLHSWIVLVPMPVNVQRRESGQWAVLPGGLPTLDAIAEPQCAVCGRAAADAFDDPCEPGGVIDTTAASS